MTTRLLQTVYVEAEGKPSMEVCIRESFLFCRDHRIGKVVLFTGAGDGAMFAVDNFLTNQEFESIQMIAVTPPSGKRYRSDPFDESSVIVASGVSPEKKEFLRDMGVPVVSAHMPFKTSTGTGVAAWNETAEAFGILGGGFSLCVQAILMACDAGEVDAGERVVAASADTSIVAIASRTELFLAPHHGLLVEHIICRPRQFNISKSHHAALANMGRFGDMANEPPAQRYIDAVVAGEDPERLISGVVAVDDDDDLP